jgi:hypothetical protein
MKRKFPLVPYESSEWLEEIPRKKGRQVPNVTIHKKTDLVKPTASDFKLNVEKTCKGVLLEPEKQVKFNAIWAGQSTLSPRTPDGQLSELSELMLKLMQITCGTSTLRVT